jgi:hypothetical protein
MAFAMGIRTLQPGKSHANPSGQGIYFISLVLAFFRISLRFLFTSVTFFHSGQGVGFTPYKVRGKKPTPRQPSVGNVKGGGFEFFVLL